MTKSTAPLPTQALAQKTRNSRKWHKTLGLISLVFIVLFSTTGLLLAWKKNSGGKLQAPTQKGISTLPEDWKSLAELQEKAQQALQEKYGATYPTAIDRIDVRPEKGMAKFIFKDHYQAVQLDLTTGKVLLHETRTSDWIEKLHDGSLVDEWLNSKELVKLLYSTLGGLLLLALGLTGFRLWQRPRKIRKLKQ